jgi:hypothetical protein
VALKSGDISKLSVSNPLFIVRFSFLVFVFEVDLLHVTASVRFLTQRKQGMRTLGGAGAEIEAA